MKRPIDATCQCGQVSYRLYKAPKLVVACHCTECQKLSTSPFSISAIVDRTTIEFTGSMKQWQRVTDSGKENYAKFCPTCGNRIYHYNPQQSDIIRLKLKPINLEDDTLFQPSVHVWTCEKLTWYELKKGITSFAQQPC